MQHIYIYIYILTAFRKIDKSGPTPGQRFDKFPTAGTSKMTNARQMPGGGGWARLELTEPS